VADDVAVPGNLGSVPNPNAVTEIEWQILQTDTMNPSVNELRSEKQVGNGKESVTRRYEFYKYLGRFDGEGLVDPLMAQLLGDLIKKLKFQLHLTSVVVTHDMRLARKLADRIVFLHEAKVIFFGTYDEMERSPEPIVQEFLELDELTLEA